MAMFDFFSQFGKKQEKALEEPEIKDSSFVPPTVDDAVIIETGGVVARSIDFGTTTNETNEVELINAWRELASRPEIDYAIQEIVNEAIETDYSSYPVDIEVPDELKLPKKVKDKIQEEFLECLKLLEFNRTATDKFRQWYVDGRMLIHLVLDPDDNTKGITSIRIIDPRTIRKVVEIEKVKLKNGIEVDKVKDTYFVYTSSTNGKSASLLGRQTQSIKVHPDAIAYANSGVFRDKGDGTTIAISHLDKSLKVANQMKQLEDSLVIYRLARAPERRIFYVDVGNLPRTKAEQYLNSVKNSFKNKMTYDTVTGEVKDSRQTMSMLEDYWLPRRDGGRGTEVTTLPGGQNLGEMDDVDYFHKKMYQALNIPRTRLNSEGTFSMGRSGEITREEIKFTKFVNYLRNKFSMIFVQMLKTQCVTKNIVTAEDFEVMAPSLTFKWQSSAYWDELMFNEMWQQRAALLQQLEQYKGQYFSKDWLMRNVLNLSQDEVDDMQRQIDKENAEDPPEEDGEEDDNGPNFVDRNNDGIPDRQRIKTAKAALDGVNF